MNRTTAATFVRVAVATAAIAVGVLAAQSAASATGVIYERHAGIIMEEAAPADADIIVQRGIIVQRDALDTAEGVKQY